MKRNILIILGIIILVGLVIFMINWFNAPKFAGAWYHCGTAYAESDCPKTTPSPTPIEEYYHYTCNKDHQCVQVEGKGKNTCKLESEDCKVKPTNTPEPTGTPQPQSTNPPSTTDGPVGAPSGPQCSGIMLAPTFITVGRMNSTQVYAKWTSIDSFVTHYIVWYGNDPSASSWNTFVDGNDVVLSNLPPKLPLWVRVAGDESSCIGPFSLSIDPRM